MVGSYHIYVKNADFSAVKYLSVDGSKVSLPNDGGGDVYIFFGGQGYVYTSFVITWTYVYEDGTLPPPTATPTATPTHPPPTDTPPTPHPLDCKPFTGPFLRYPTQPTDIAKEDVCWYFTPDSPGTVWFTLLTPLEGSYLSYHIEVMNADHSETRSLSPSRGAKVSLPNNAGKDVYISFGGKGYIDTGFVIRWSSYYIGNTLSPPTATPPTEAPTPSPWVRTTYSPETEEAVTLWGGTSVPLRWTQTPPHYPAGWSSSSGDGSDGHTGVSPLLIVGSIVGGLLLVGGLVAAVVISQSQGSAADPAVGTGVGIPENVFVDTAGQDVVLNECPEEMGAWVAME